MTKLVVRISLVLAVIAVSYVLWKKGDSFIQTKGYTSIPTFLRITISNYLEGSEADKSVRIRIKPEDFKKIEAVRDAAIKRGVIIQPDDPYVPCEIEYNGEKIKGEIRLKGKMTDHVSGKKWSFRVKTKKNRAFMGMQRFTLQHPGTRGYVYEWLHHQMCKQEEIIALRYEFVNLSVNDNDLGVYAVEENFGQPLVQNNNRPKGPVFRFNPTLYWQARLNMVNRVYIAQEFTNFQNAHIEAFSKKETFEDEYLKQSFVEANNLMNQLRWGQKSVAEVFDVEKLAMRYALLDLCGGYHSVDWSDVKFYYNPVLKKIEPVAYESFGPRYIDQVIGNYRFTDSKSEFPTDYHDIIFSDRTFFSYYIKALRHVSRIGYFEESIEKVKDELDKRIAIQYSEFPYKDFNLEVFHHNLTTIRKTLEAPKNFHAYFQERRSDTLNLQLQVIESLPTVVLGIVADGNKIELDTPILLPGLDRSHKPYFKNLHCRVDTSILIDKERCKNLSVYYKLLGDTALRSCEVFPYSIENYEGFSEAKNTSSLFSNKHDYITIDSTAKHYFINTSEVVLNEVIEIPVGWTLKATSPLNIEFKDGAQLVCHGTLNLSGTDDQLINLQINSTSKYGITVIGKEGRSNIKNVEISGTCNTVFLLYNGVHRLEQVLVKTSGKNILESFNAQIKMKECVFEGASKAAIKSSFCVVTSENILFSDCKTAIDTKSGKLNLVQSKIRVCSKALESKRNDEVKFTDVSIDSVKTGMEIRDGSAFSWNKGTLTNSILGFKVYRKGNLYGSASIRTADVKSNGVDQLYYLEEGNSFEMDGKPLNPNK